MQDVVSQPVEAVAGKELLLPCWSVLTGLWAQLKSCSELRRSLLIVLALGNLKSESRCDRTWVSDRGAARHLTRWAGDSRNG